jgi:hypothetical protein
MQALNGTCTRDEQELQPHHVTEERESGQSAFLEVVEETKDAEDWKEDCQYPTPKYYK